MPTASLPFERNAVSIAAEPLSIERAPLPNDRNAVPIGRGALANERDAVPFARDSVPMVTGAVPFDRVARSIHRGVLAIDTDALALRTDALAFHTDPPTFDAGAPALHWRHPVSEPKGITSTEAVHAGDARDKPYDAVPTPIVQTATYTFANSEAIAAFTEGRDAVDREEYGRYGNPTARAVELRIAALEGTEDAALFASGMAALTTSVLALVKSGQHVVLFRDCYRMTLEFTTDVLARFGVSHTLLDAGDVAALPGALRPETRLVLSESPTNPYLSCIDLAALAAACKARRGVKSLVDATFATPVNCRPASFGVDLVVHSATKYLAGHNDVLAGAVCGSRDLVSLVRDLRDVLGGVCDPHAAYLVGRGMKTLAIRVARQNATAQALAERLEKHPRVERVFYPGLPSHASHAVARAQMRGFGGVVSFVVKGGLEAGRRVVDAMRVARIAPSFGGVESLVEQPAVMSYYAMTTEERAAIGIADGLVRLSVGIEEPEDLVADVERALGA
jgi:cystathionine gamma-synthase